MDLHTNSPGTRLALGVVTVLSDTPDGCTQAQLLERLGDPAPSTLNRVLRLLTAEGWLRRGEGRYFAGTTLVSQACRLVSTVTGEEHLGPIVKELAETTHQSAAFAKWHGTGFRFHAKHEMPDSFHYVPLGELNPHNLYNPFAIVCLAFLPEATVRRIASEPQPIRSLFDDGEHLESTLGRIRKEKAFVCRDTVMRVVAPVFYRSKGLFAGAIGISMLGDPLDAGDEERLRSIVIQAAQRAGNNLPRSFK